MESRTEFNPSNFLFIVKLLKDFLSPMRKRSFLTTGININASKNNYNSLKISHLILSMMDHLLQPVHLIMGISLQGPSRMLFVDMLYKLAITFPEDSVGIVTDFQLNMKLIRILKSLIKDKF